MVFADYFPRGETKISPQHNHYYGGCGHWREPVRVGRFVVTCSALTFNHALAPPVPGFGVYLAAGWRDILGKCWTNGSYLKRLAQERPYPALVREWPDAGVVPTRDLTQLVEICLSKMRKGLVVDIGCLAGHGRTGTLLACLIARVEHLPAERAIDEVHHRYCRHAIETKTQQDAVADYCKTIKHLLRRG